ncbi:MAG: 4-hydroxythreonine-4-phosphate dehydrogenase PdxA [Lautropia sp.]|nr:4-hydroxythreonine-4-phosphate dehydrogenase PdxA [Lautropia sp.]
MEGQGHGHGQGQELVHLPGQVKGKLVGQGDGDRQGLEPWQKGQERRLLKPIALTMGDPAGIGPEILMKALLAFDRRPQRPFFRLYGDEVLLASLAARYGLDRGLYELVSCGHLGGEWRVGQVSAAAGGAAFRAVRQAALDAMAGEVRAVVTAPLSKAAMNLAGHHYPGHTEILAQLAGGVPVRMMLANLELRTVLVSIHVPLLEAVRSLSTVGILETIQLTDRFLKRTGMPRPRIAVAGLNPHAGEDGLLGTEEQTTIGPAVRMAQAEGIDASGPYPPDTVFMRARGFQHFDVVIAMYHDQGLIPVKYMGVEDGVNLTVGLPYVRTSPDHGTAFDIAGQEKADPASMLAAIRMADQLSS